MVECYNPRLTEKEKEMLEGLKNCPRSKWTCHIEIVETKAQKPKNIRIGCSLHSFWLSDLFETIEEAIEAWNRRTSDE